MCPTSLFCNVFKAICYIRISKTIFLPYASSSFKYSVVCIFVLKKETSSKKKKEVLTACSYSNSCTHNVDYTDVFHCGGHFIGQMGAIQKCVLIINNLSSQPVSGWPLPLPYV